ncbi:hypothetical protein TEA_005735 [Camellia sinensis var. sinensis]|uniref:Uncharacterized protein n=1 Tax=Camellia sinensis var. sinensis TaxID=542762 RepID=A0A4V3WLL3_CAMSN|nr:hypothetical protein TEA_005735 [Camellia sinensis var. sinensis]
MANAIEREITALQLKEKNLVTEIKRTAKTGNELSVLPKGRIVGKTTEDANKYLVLYYKMKRKRKTCKASCIMDKALRVRASPSLPCTIDGASSPYVSRTKRKRKAFKAICIIGEALRVRESPSLPRTMDGASSSSVSSLHTISATLTRRGQGFTRGIKEWGTGTKIQDNLVYCPDEFKEVCMRLCRTSWKDHKSKTKFKYWVPFKNDPNIASGVPSNIVPAQERKLMQYWASKEVQEYNVHLWKVPKEQHSIEYCDGIYHKIVGNDGHGYRKTYGRGVPWSAMYA